MPSRATSHRSTVRAHRTPDNRRGASERGYDHDWGRLSSSHRRSHPLCVRCLETGRAVPGVLVDHLIPVHAAPHLRLSESNLQALCRACHARKTREDLAVYGSATVPK